MSLLLPVAHALVARKDLPIPAWLFAWGASIVLIVSFFALSAAWRKPRFEEERWRPVGAGFSRTLLSMPVQILCGAIGVFLLGFSIYAGLHGTEAPDRNFALTFIFVTAWLGFPLFSVILGDVFRPFNPWRAIGRVAGGAFSAVAGQRPAHLTYPEKLGRWPAAFGLLAVVWLEVVYGASGGVAVGLSPARRRARRPRLQPLHAGDDGPVRGREVVSDRRGLLGLLRDVLAAGNVRRQGRPARQAPAAVRGDPLGDRARARPRW